MLSPAQLSLRNRIGAYALHAKYDPRETTAKARATFLSSFEKRVDPEGKLPEAERLRRAEAAKREHFARMAYQRSKKRGGGGRAA